MGDSDHETDEITIPRAAMNKMIKELCPQIRVANEARELILNCCTEFIHLVSSEANDICNNQQKKTINAEHVLIALEKLGYGDFRKDAEDALAECKEVADKRKRQNKRLDQMGVSQEELRRQQQELFAKARQEAAQQEQQIILQQQQIQASKASTSSAAPAATATSSSSSDNNTNGGSNT